MALPMKALAAEPGSLSPSPRRVIEGEKLLQKLSSDLTCTVTHILLTCKYKQTNEQTNICFLILTSRAGLHST